MIHLAMEITVIICGVVWTLVGVAALPWLLFGVRRMRG